MNTLNPAGTHVIDSTGKPYALDVPHPMPLPGGIESSTQLEVLFWNTKSPKWITLNGVLDREHDMYTHWLLRPEPPAPKTQEEMDEEAFEDWKTRFAHNEISWWNTVQKAWHAGVAHGRKQP